MLTLRPGEYKVMWTVCSWISIPCPNKWIESGIELTCSGFPLCKPVPTATPATPTEGSLHVHSSVFDPPSSCMSPLPCTSAYPTCSAHISMHLEPDPGAGRWVRAGVCCGGPAVRTHASFVAGWRGEGYVLACSDGGGGGENVRVRFVNVGGSGEKQHVCGFGGATERWGSRFSYRWFEQVSRYNRVELDTGHLQWFEGAPQNELYLNFLSSNLPCPTSPTASAA
jgi:hypothetical protein